jgi:uncharacterized LabA/DUF88 family protein
MVYQPGANYLHRLLMIFIDGGYIRKVFEKVCNNDNIDFLKFTSQICSLMQTSAAPQTATIIVSLQRVYYYDAIVDSDVDQKKNQEQNQYFEIIRKLNYHQVKLARLIKTNDGFKQKGVDVLLAIDMITKAYENHYDIAALVAGDDDFIDVVKSVKDLTGKHVYGVYYPEQASKRLIEMFDRRFALKEDMIKNSLLE